jgi:hypothetical protein
LRCLGVPYQFLLQKLKWPPVQEVLQYELLRNIVTLAEVVIEPMLYQI